MCAGKGTGDAGWVMCGSLGRWHDLKGRVLEFKSGRGPCFASFWGLVQLFSPSRGLYLDAYHFRSLFPFFMGFAEILCYCFGLVLFQGCLFDFIRCKLLCLLCCEEYIWSYRLKLDGNVNPLFNICLFLYKCHWDLLP